MRTLSAVLAAFLVLTLCAGFPRRPSDVSAGTALRLDTAELTRRAELILEGRVLQARPVEHAGMIETEYLLQVERTFRGEDQAFRTLRLPGGVLPDGRGMVLAGVPELVPGELALLFLSRESKGVRMPVGLSQGKFRVVDRGPAGRFLLQEPAGLSLIGPDGERVRPGLETRPVPYAEVVAGIEAALARERSR